jgi:nickel transport protein
MRFIPMAIDFDSRRFPRLRRLFVKSLFSRASAATLATISAVLSSAVCFPGIAQALSTDEIVRRLDVVPVFSVTQENGQPILVFPKQPGQAPADPKPADGAILHFVDPDDVREFATRVQSEAPEPSKKVNLALLTLGQFYRMWTEMQSKPEMPSLVVNPSKEDVEAAIAILKQQGQTVERFNGIPLFYAVDPQAGDAPLTLKADNREVVPFFFSKRDLQAMLDDYKQRQPDIINRAQLRVFTLDGLIEELKKATDPNSLVASVRLIPSSQAAAFYVRAMQASQQGGANGQGAARPNTPAPSGAAGLGGGQQPAPANR